MGHPLLDCANLNTRSRRSAAKYFACAGQPIVRTKRVEAGLLLYDATHAGPRAHPGTAEPAGAAGDPAAGAAAGRRAAAVRDSAAHAGRGPGRAVPGAPRPGRVIAFFDRF